MNSDSFHNFNTPRPDCRGANWIAMLRLDGEETAASEVESIFFSRDPFKQLHSQISI